MHIVLIIAIHLSLFCPKCQGPLVFTQIYIISKKNSSTLSCLQSQNHHRQAFGLRKIVNKFDQCIYANNGVAILQLNSTLEKEIDNKCVHFTMIVCTLEKISFRDFGLNVELHLLLVLNCNNPNKYTVRYPRTQCGMDP